MKTVRTITITLPEASDEMGRWMDRNGASIRFTNSLGRYSVTVTKRKVVQYDDERGCVVHQFDVERSDKALDVAMSNAVAAAMGHSWPS